MKLIDILVEELPKRGGWPDDSDEMSQSQFDCEIYTESKFLPDFYVGERAEDNGIDNGVTREQYEAALAAKNDGWIEWGGGECPLHHGAIIDAKDRDGYIHHGGVVGESCCIDDIFWRRGVCALEDNEIIAYRLHQPKEVAQTKAEREVDLNTAAEWNGEGLPLVGCECEWQDKNTKQWNPVKVVYASEWVTVIREINKGKGDDLVEIAIENYGDDSRLKFRPIRSEEYRKREEAAQALCDAGGGNGKVDEKTGYGSCWFDVYDAIASGKIPGIKLED